MENNSHLSLTQLQLLIRERIGDAFPMPLWVVAEISEIKVNYSGHCYLELVEKGGRNQVPKARASSVIWRSSYGAIDSYFCSVTGKQLAVGMQVLVKTSVVYHEIYGLSLQISDIDPKYTLGDMEQQRQMTIAQLQQEGVFDMNRELGLPLFIQRVAVVSSRNAAGYQDFMKELESSEFRFELTLFDAFMQGSGSQDSIILALEAVLERLDDFDAVAIIRGGGSQSDLGSFDSYRLCCHIAQFPLPVITGIGHDKDQSVADLVASVSLKTPTAVAGYLIDGLARELTNLDSLQEAATSFVVDAIEGGLKEVRELAFAVSSSTAGLTRSVEMKLERLGAELQRVGENTILRRTVRLDKVEEAVVQRVTALLESNKATLGAAERVVNSRRPENILSLGFAIVRVGDKAVKSSELLAVGSQIDITFGAGSATAQINMVKKTGR